MNAHRRAAIFRELAGLVDRQREAWTLPGVSAPPQIMFYGQDGKELASYGDNPTLRDMIKEEIRANWDDLRTKAFARLAGRIAALEQEAAEALQSSPSPLAAEGKSEGEPSEVVDRGGAR